MRRYLLALFLCFFIFSNPAFSQTKGEINLDLVSNEFWGGTWEMSLHDNYLYCNMNPGVQIYDITNPVEPILVNRLEHGNAASTVFYNDYMFVGSNADKLYLYNNIDPGNPVLIDEIPMTISPYGMFVYDTYLFVIGDYGLLSVYSLADPLAPEILSEYAAADDLRHVYLENNRLYFTVFSHGVEIVDFSDPANPVHIGYTEYDGFSAYSAAYKDNYILFSTDYDYPAGGMAVFDVTNESYPTLVDTVLIDGLVTTNILKQVGNTVYTYVLGEGLYSIDISDINNITLTDFYEISQGYFTDIEVYDDYIYLSESSEGIYIFDKAGSQGLEEVGRINQFASIHEICKVNDFIFMGEYNNGLRIINASDPSSPTLESINTDFGEVREFDEYGNFIFVKNRSNGVKILDVSNPQTPALITNIPTDSRIRNISFSDNLALFAEYDYGLKVYDISDINNPALLYQLTPPYNVVSAILHGDILYIGTGDNGEGESETGLHVVDFTDPQNPVYLSLMSEMYLAQDFIIIGDYLYTNYYEDRAHMSLGVLDISNPTNPIHVGNVKLTTISARLSDIAGDYAFMPNDLNGVQIINISNPNDPYIAYTYDTPGWSRDLVVENEVIYLSDNSSLRIASFSSNGFRCGDINDDSQVNIMDITYLISYLYLGGIAPNIIETADVDGSGTCNLLDITFLINYLYLNGETPICS